MKPNFFIFGFGYTAKALANQLISQGFSVIGTSRLPEEQQKEHAGVKIIDFNSPHIQAFIGQSTHILISTPPANTQSDLVLIQYGELIKQQTPYLKWLGYLSSTGVYGNYQGNWVNEDSECIPHTSAGIARLKAEQAWIAFAKENQLPLHVFRLSGIYGPARNAIDRMIHGKKYSIYKEGQVFCRVHVEDIVSTLLASIQSPKALSIYNVSDDEPAPAHIVDQYAAKLLHQKPLPLIPFAEAHLSPMEQEFYANNRRVSNIKIKEEFNMVLKYPTYREGLTQIWKDHFAPQ